MAKWIQRTVDKVTVSGGSWTVQFAPATAGNLLMLIVHYGSSVPTPSGWTPVITTAGLGEWPHAHVFSKTATSGEGSVTLSPLENNEGMIAIVYEFPADTSILDGDAQVEFPRSGVAVTGLSDLASDPKLLMHIAAYNSADANWPAAETPTWGDSTTTDVWDGQDSGPGLLAGGFLVGYLEDSTLLSWAPTVFLANSELFHFNTSRITLAISVSEEPEPEPLDTPVLTLVNKTNPSTPSGDDGTITVSWPPVANADHYESGIAPGPNANQEDIVLVDNNVTSPYQFTGLSAGTYTVAIRAIPAE